MVDAWRTQLRRCHDAQQRRERAYKQSHNREYGSNQEVRITILLRCLTTSVDSLALINIINLF